MWNCIRFSDPFHTIEEVVVSYLYYLFKTGKSYSVINTHKAMLLQTLPFFDNTWCKDCVLIARFMKSVFLQTPPKPRYIVTWDVSIVLKFLRSLMPLNSLSLKLLTFKTVALVALATAPRAQTLASMNLDNMLIEQQAVVFCFTNFLKVSKVGQSFCLKIEHFQDEALCAMHTLLHYIKVTEKLRLSRNVFVSYVTYKVVCTSTLARWLKTVLELSGIDSSRFKAHSFRGASVSAAYSKGCSLKAILSTADWSSDKNFRKFYFRHSLRKDNVSFTNAVFQI